MPPGASAFRFAPTKILCNQKIRVSPHRAARLLIESHWKNSGVAPCYDSYALHWSLINAQGETVAQKLSFPAVPTTHWWPGEEITQNDVLTVPAGAALGGLQDCLWRWSSREEPSLLLRLALPHADAQGRYEIAALPTVTAADTPQTVFQDGFEEDFTGWHPAQGHRDTPWRRRTQRRVPAARRQAAGSDLELRLVSDSAEVGAGRTLPSLVLVESGRHHAGGHCAVFEDRPDRCRLEIGSPM